MNDALIPEIDVSSKTCRIHSGNDSSDNYFCVHGTLDRFTISGQRLGRP